MELVTRYGGWVRLPGASQTTVLGRVGGEEITHRQELAREKITEDDGMIVLILKNFRIPAMNGKYDGCPQSGKNKLQIRKKVGPLDPYDE